jgi:hypothetical protein
MSVLIRDQYAEFQVIDCDWCQEEATCRSLFQGDVWIMSICKKCEKGSLA